MTEDDNVLQNPTTSDLAALRRELEEAQINTQPSRMSLSQQLRLDDQAGFWGMRQTIGAWKNRLMKREQELEMMPFWRLFPAPLAVTTTVVTFIFATFNGLRFFPTIPPSIPFYYNALESKWEQADKSLVLIIPILVLAIDSIILRLIYEVFRYDKRLSYMLSLLLSMVNILIIIALSQMYSLIL